MKKIIFTLICILMLPIIVHADYSLPMAYNYNVSITNQNGASVYSLDGEMQSRTYTLTSEKIAYGHYFDGKVDIIYGTHTHVQTSDSRILPKGSAYITDVGMTGPLDGVIGTKKEIIINRFLNGAREVFEPQDTGNKQFCAIIVEINDLTHKVTHIDRINVLN
jgi:calcineurin-like phosphoesterase